MKINFALRSLLVIDLWISMAVITSIIFELSFFPDSKGMISLCLFAGGLLINLIITAFCYSTRKRKVIKNKQ